jgi:ABC-type transporter lipoprotein component MlaA
MRFGILLTSLFCFLLSGCIHRCPNPDDPLEKINRETFLMNTKNLIGKLYLIPTTLGESNPDDVLPQTVKRAIEFIVHYIVENEKTARKCIKSIKPDKLQSSLILITLNKYTEIAEHI